MRRRVAAELGVCGRWLPLFLMLMLVCVIGAAQAAPAPPSNDRAGAAASPAPAANSRPASDTAAAIRARGVMRVGVAVSAPMVVHSQDTVAGFSVDVARRLAADLGVRAEFVLATWETVIPDLVSGRTDVVIAGLWPTVERALQVNFTSPTATEGIYLFASRKVGGRTPGDFDRPEVRIATFPGTPQAAVARKNFPRATHVDVKADERELDVVLSGRADAAVVSTIAPRGVLAAVGNEISLPFWDPLQTTSAAIAIRKGDPDFLNFLDTWLGIRRGEGWLDERAAAWTEEMEWYGSEVRSRDGGAARARADGAEPQR